MGLETSQVFGGEAATPVGLETSQVFGGEAATPVGLKTSQVFGGEAATPVGLETSQVFGVAQGGASGCRGGGGARGSVPGEGFLEEVSGKVPGGGAWGRCSGTPLSASGLAACLGPGRARNERERTEAQCKNLLVENRSVTKRKRHQKTHADSKKATTAKNPGRHQKTHLPTTKNVCIDTTPQARGHFRNVPRDRRGYFRNVPPPWRSSGPLPGRSAGRPAKGKKPKGRNGSDPKLNCVTRRVRFCFWCFGEKTRFLHERCQKKNQKLSRPSLGRFSARRAPKPEGELIAGSLLTFSCAPCVGSFPECAPGPAGSFPECAPGPAGSFSECASALEVFGSPPWPFRRPPREGQETKGKERKRPKTELCNPSRSFLFLVLR